VTETLTAHWNQAYASRGETQVSWYQSRPQRSLDFIRRHVTDVDASLIDVGGGASILTDALLDAGYSHITVLDISDAALERAQSRLGARAAAVSWLTADITAWQPPRTWDVWHDRAVFHFLTQPTAQDAYIAALMKGTHAGSVVVMATFAPTGPEKCSGLPVQRYSPASLAARLGNDFALHDEGFEIHQTPWGSSQDFAYAVFRRR